MNRAFIFDMDGVLIDSEREWHKGGHEDFPKTLFGEKIYQELESEMMGGDSKTWYALAIKKGFTMPLPDYYAAWDEHMKTFYPFVPLTKDAEELIEYLSNHSFKLGLVSSSRMNWINMVLPRLPYKNKFSYILSVNEHDDLQAKPAPDGYLDAIKHLGSDPKHSIILEDSNRGIQSAKAAGAYVIGFKGNLVPGYEQKGADAYVDSMDDVEKIVESINLPL